MTHSTNTAVVPVGALTAGPERVRVWDPVIRLFHWSLAVAVLIAVVTERQAQVAQPVFTEGPL